MGHRPGALSAAVAMPGLVRALRRELRWIARSPRVLLLLGPLPLAGWLAIAAIFSAGVPTDLPLAVVDLDRSSLSRQAIRMIDAAPSIRVCLRLESMAQAESWLRSGGGYGFVVVPSGFERDVKRSRSPALSAFVDTQRLLAASLIRRDLRTAAGTLSAGVELKIARARGLTEARAMAAMEPIRADVHTLFNPYLSYVPFLFWALVPTLLQIFVATSVTDAFGRELKHGTARAWLDAGGGRLAPAVLGKALPYVTVYSALGLAALGVAHAALGVPVRGSAALLAAGMVLMVCAYAALAIGIVAWTANVRLALSAAALLTAPAFAFVGVTFPAHGMQAPAAAWAGALPLTYALRIGLEQGIRGAAARASAVEIGVLCLFTTVPLLASWWRLSRVCRDERYWGRQ